MFSVEKYSRIMHWNLFTCNIIWKILFYLKPNQEQLELDHLFIFDVKLVSDS